MFGKKCHRRIQEEHFEKCCKTNLKRDKAKQKKNKVHWVESASSEDSDDEQFFIIGNKHAAVTCNVQIAGELVNLLIENGASCNVIDSDTCKTLKPNVKLNKYDKKVYVYGSNSPLHVHVLANFETNISINNQKRKMNFSL